MRFCGLAVVLLMGCREPTEIALDLSTNEPCAAVARTDIATGAAEGDLATRAQTSACDAGAIGSIVLVPSADDRARVRVEVTTTLQTGCDGGPCTIVARRKLGYVSHTRLRLSIELRAECANVACPSDETCVFGRCAPADEADPGYLDAGAAGDASIDGPLDAASDAGPPSSTDAAPDAPITPACAPPGAPELYVPLGDGVTAMAVTPQELFWTTSSTHQLWRMSRDQPSSARMIAAGGVDRVGANATTAYWSATNVSGIYAFDLASSTVIAQVYSGSVYALAVDANDVYFTTDRSEVRAGKSSAPLALGNGPGSIAEAGDAVYFGDVGGLYTVPKRGGQSALLVPRPQAVGFIVADSAAVFWVELVGGGFQIIRWDGASATQLASPPGLPFLGLALTTPRVYAYTGSGLSGYDRVTGAPSAVDARPSMNGAVAGDDACLYYARSGEGIYRAAP